MTAKITGTVATEIEVDLAEELESRLRGQLVRPTDDDYNEARLVWNGTIELDGIHHGIRSGLLLPLRRRR